VLRGFKVEHVFELGQTTGAPVPEPVRPILLEGEAPPGLGHAVLEMIEGRGYSVDTVESAAAIGGANGRTDWGARSVVVCADMDDAAMVKTLIHEAAHVLLHEQPPGRYVTRQVKEVEAESVAYVVSVAHGMSTDQYSFPYVAAWAGDNAAGAIQASQGRIAHAARTIIEASPAVHEPGGKVPGAVAAVAAAPTTHPPGLARRTISVSASAGSGKLTSRVRAWTTSNDAGGSPVALASPRRISVLASFRSVTVWVAMAT
jgi:hypothetical protein